MGGAQEPLRILRSGCRSKPLVKLP